MLNNRLFERNHARSGKKEKNEAMLWLVFGCKYVHKIMTMAEKVVSKDPRLVVSSLFPSLLLLISVSVSSHDFSPFLSHSPFSLFAECVRVTANPGTKCAVTHQISYSAMK